MNSTSKNCAWCGDEFNPNADSRRLTHQHRVLRRPMRTDTKPYKVYRVSGGLCCRCRNIPRANVPDQIMKNEPIMEGSADSHYPTGNYKLIVSAPGKSVTVKA